MSECCVMDSVMQWWAFYAPASSRLCVFWICLLAWSTPSSLSRLQLRCFCLLLLALPCVRLIFDLLERPAVMQFRNWSSGPHQLTMGSQGSPPSPSSSLSTPKAWQIRTKMDPARFSHWQMTGSYTKHQRIPGGSRSSATSG